MIQTPGTMRSIFTVWLRYFAVFRKNLLYGIVTTFVEPLLYLASFGFGLGSMVGDIHSGLHIVSYRAFVLGGMVGQTILFTAFFDGAFGGFVRMYYQRVFQAIAVTPITLTEVLWGELFWCSSRAVLSASVVLLIGSSLGDFSLVGTFEIIPVVFVGALLFSALGMLVAALSRTIESISYPQFLLIFPMFLFCGVYFPLGNLPVWVQGVAWLLPLTSILSLVRCFALGFDFQWWTVPILLIWTIVLVLWARRSMRLRLVA